MVVFPEWSTPVVADACLRLGLELRLGPFGLRPLAPEMRVCGAVRPVQHFGSVDVFIEAAGMAQSGEVMMIDNGGRLDEGCVGDLSILEMRHAGLPGVVVWGAHRDSAELRRIGFPVFSLGAFAAGPRRLDPRTADVFARASCGEVVATADDFVFADEDGVLVVPKAKLGEIVGIAAEIQRVERKQATAIAGGRPLRDQLQFAAYLKRRAAEPQLTFRQHLREIRGAIEE